MKQINYPNGSSFNTTVTQSLPTSKGMNLEAMIETSNKYYYNNHLAWVVKYPTPIQVIKTTSHNHISDGYFKTPSCCDYIGFIDGSCFVFEAKVTQSLQRFYFNQIAPHQLQHLSDALSYGASAFIIVYFQKLNKAYYLDARDVLASIQNNRKSYTIEQFNQSNCLIEFKSIQCPLDYLSLLHLRR